MIIPRSRPFKVETQPSRKTGHASAQRSRPVGEVSVASGIKRKSRWALFAACLFTFTNWAPAFHPDAANFRGSSTAGQYLVASRQLRAPPFAESVVYVLDHNAAGALGLIINRPVTSAPIRDILSAQGLSTKNNKQIPLFLGGPVDITRVFVLHSRDYNGVDTRVLGPNLALSVMPGVILSFAEREVPTGIRVMLGYAGWAAGQLEAEIARRDWAVIPADPELIFSTETDKLWSRALARIQTPL